MVPLGLTVSLAGDGLAVTAAGVDGEGAKEWPFDGDRGK
jgi:hypothetical protein